MLFAANIAIEQEVIEAAITIAFLILHLHSSDIHQHRTFNRNRAETCSEGLTSSEVRFLQSFRVYKKWNPLSSNFERLIHSLSM